MRSNAGLAAIMLWSAVLFAQTTAAPRFGVNISRGFAYTCPPSDTTCSPYVDYAGIPAWAYTDSQGQRTPFANWVRDQQLPPLQAAGFRQLRIFFSPGADMACHGCGYSGGDIGHRPYLLTRGSPYLSGQSFGTSATPGLQPWVYTNLKMFFQDCAAAGLDIDLVLQWDENYGNWTAPSAANLFVGYPALRDIWLNATQALVDSGAGILQVEPHQEQQFFNTVVEDHLVALDSTPGYIQSRIIPPGDWGNEPRGQYAADLMDAMMGPLQSKFPQIAGRIYPGLELRGEAAGACNIDTFNGWGDGPWSTTDVQSMYSYIAARNAATTDPTKKLVFPWTISVHRYLTLDVNGNPEETPAQVQQVFDDLYAYHSGDQTALVTKCAAPAVSPQKFAVPPVVILAETNSDAVIAWNNMNVVTQGYTQSRLAGWLGGGYNGTLLMPWFYGVNLDPWDPQTALSSIFTK